MLHQAIDRPRRRAAHPPVSVLARALRQPRQLEHSNTMPVPLLKQHAEQLEPERVRVAIETAIDAVCATRPNSTLSGRQGIAFVEHVLLNLAAACNRTKRTYVLYVETHLRRLNEQHVHLLGQMYPLTSSFCADPAIVARINEVHPLANAAWDMHPACVVGVGFEDIDGTAEVLAVVQHVGVNLGKDHKYCAVRLVDLPLAVAGRLLGLAAAALLYQECKLDIEQGTKRGMARLCHQAAAELHDTLTECEDAMRPGQLCVKAVAPQNAFINWLPFTEEEADSLAFGTRVSVDALPAFELAVRLNHANDSGFVAPPLGDPLSLV